MHNKRTKNMSALSCVGNAMAIPVLFIVVITVTEMYRSRTSSRRSVMLIRVRSFCRHFVNLSGKCFSWSMIV